MVPAKTEEIRPRKFYLLESKHPNGVQILKMCFEKDVLTMTVSLGLSLPWWKRCWIALCFVFGFEGPLGELSKHWMTFEMKEEDANKLLSLSTVAYLRHLQKKKLNKL